MSGLTIQRARAPKRSGEARAWRLARRRGPALAAGVLVLFEAGLALAGVRSPALSLTVLVLAPGLALLPLLPAPARRSWSSALAAAPALGFGAAAVALVSLSSAGIPLGPVSCRLAVAAIVAVGMLLPERPPPARSRDDLIAGGALAAICGLGLVLHARILGELPVPGNDWAKYVLYADEAARAGSLLIDNPYWLLGVPFREDPAVPALYAAWLQLTGEPAVALAHGIELFTLMAVLAIYTLVSSLWGRGGGLAAAAVYALVPLNQTLLGWHGLANAAALALIPLILLYAAVALRGRLDDQAGVGAGLALVATAATHRLSLLVCGLALAAAVVLGCAFADRRRLLRPLGLALGAAAVLSAGVVWDLAERNRTFGGTLDHTAYLSSKLDLGLLVRDLTLPFALLAGVALVLALSRARADRAVIPLLALVAVSAALSVSWLVHMPLHYTRMAYYLPLALAPLVAVALYRLPRARLLAPLSAALLCGFLAAVSFSRSERVVSLYEFANPSSLRGLDAVAASLRPNEVVVTDRCWSFLSTWLLQTRTLSALETVDIQPKAELRRVRQARAVLAGTALGTALADRLGVRWAIVDPSCPDAEGRPMPPPRIGRPAFVSERLVVLRLR